MGNMWSRALRLLAELVRSGVPLEAALTRVAPLYGMAVDDLRRLHEGERRSKRRRTT